MLPREVRLTELRGHEGRVLLVSAPGLDRELYVAALADAGFATVVVETARSATDWLAGAETPDVIVMDLVPEPDQTWALVERSTTPSCSVPVIIFTSLIRPDGANRRKARSVGCAAFVAKPCSLRQLVDVVSRVHHGERGLEVSAYSE
jgi:DNA-binding NtrC family response regulator